MSTSDWVIVWLLNLTAAVPLFLQVERDSKSLVELLRHVALVLKILKLGSAEEQLKYVSTWSKMISACARELKHGASIWKQALEKNVSSQILSEKEGMFIATKNNKRQW